MVDLHLLGEVSSALLWLDCNSLVLDLFGVLLKCCLFVALEASPNLKVKQHLAPSEQAGGLF